MSSLVEPAPLSERGDYDAMTIPVFSNRDALVPDASFAAAILDYSQKRDD